MASITNRDLLAQKQWLRKLKGAQLAGFTVACDRTFPAGTTWDVVRQKRERQVEVKLVIINGQPTEVVVSFQVES